MNRKATPQKLILLSSMTVLFTLVTLVFGAPFLRVLRRSYGIVVYWSFGILTAGIFWYLQSPLVSVMVISLWMALGVQMEAEKFGLRWWISGLWSVGLGTVVGMMGCYALLVQYDLTTTESQEKFLNEFLSQLQGPMTSMKIEPWMLMQMSPSIIAVGLILSLGVGAIFERRVYSWLDLPRQRFVSQINFLEFRIPDAMIWVTLVSLLFTAINFGNFWLEVVARNIVIVAGALYFFQGLAVLEVFLRAVRAGFFFRFLSYFIFVGQMFFVLTVLGFVDFWVDFRRRLRASESADKAT